MGALPKLIVITGPTASGKTLNAAAVAHHFGSEVISADARQFYHPMRIGTARPSEVELLGVPHHFLGHLDLETTWSAGEFARAAEPVLQRILRDHGMAVLTGGSGLYIDALCRGLDALPASDGSVRAELVAQMQAEGLPALVERLGKLDPVTASNIDARNPHRVLRALEITLVSGEPASAQRKGSSMRTDIQVIPIALDLPRAELYARIDARVDRMMTDGLEEEARSLQPYRHLNALNTVGYKELFSYFDGAHTLPEAVAAIKQHTRNYAKRQLTWIRRTPHHTIPPDPWSIIDHLEHGL